MPTAPAHAKPARRDLLWVLVLILACGLLEVWASWLSIGAVSGFPKLGSMTTGWILPVTTEAYWSAALFAWLAVPAGPKSAAFAKWSAAAMFVLSLAGQESDHLLAAAGRTAPPVLVVGFVTALPLISVALIAILIHLRQTDRDDAAAAAQARRAAEEEAHQASAEAARIAELEAALETAQAEAQTARQAASEAQENAAQAARRIEVLERKLAAQKPARTRAQGSGAGRTKPPAKAPHADPETAVPDDFDARTEALGIWLGNPDISGRELAEKVGMKERWGQLRKNEFAASNTGPDQTSAPGPAGPA